MHTDNFQQKEFLKIVFNNDLIYQLYSDAWITNKIFIHVKYAFKFFLFKPFK